MVCFYTYFYAMNLREILLTDNSKHAALRIERWIGKDPGRMDLLMELFLNGEYRLNQRAAYPLIFISDNNPQLFVPYLERMTRNLTDDKHDAVIRNTLRLFQNIDLPESIEGELYDKCIHYLNSPKYPVAIRVFAMTILVHTSVKYPELKSEIQPLIEDILQISESAGMHSRGKKMLAILNQLEIP
jgi:predicted DCC family thiol-disulfide oxidoreductase YuxK